MFRDYPDVVNLSQMREILGKMYVHTGGNKAG